MAKDAKGRVVYGVHPVMELLQSRRGAVQELWVSDRRAASLKSLVQRAESCKVRLRELDSAALDALAAGASHQGVVALTGEYQYANYESLLSPTNRVPLLLFADSVTDPQNLGAMVRAAVVLGATGLVLPRDRSAAITPATVRVSAGATEYLQCAKVTNLSRAIEQAKKAGIWVVAAVEAGGVAPEELDLRQPTALVLGNEHKGVRPSVQKHCDVLVTIPAAGPIAALNVASATTALFYEAARQRRA